MVLWIFYLAALIISTAATALILRWLIPKLKSIKMGQKILEIGPRWHKSKEGTPTMGGIAFIAGITIALALSFGAALLTSDILSLGGTSRELKWIAVVFGYALINALIGVVDDVAKFKKQQNEGLTAPQKYLLQLAAAASFLFMMRALGLVSTEIYFPFFDYTLVLAGFGKIVYYIVMLLLLTGMVNSVNLTDGIDGLASSITLVVCAFFSVIAFIANRADCALLASSCLGGCLGFLVYNFHPAKVFMGDTGSLFLGAFVVGCAFSLNNPLIILLCGLVYVIETASVMLQVGYFKLTHGKRIFKMTPIHHHFEQCGWGEVKIVSVFSAITAIFCVIAYFGF